ncbi:MAG: TA system VapC family ribonuclease toxin [Archangium sp.]
MIWLLDGNVLIASAAPNSPHHLDAREWIDRNVRRFATCPITQGAFLRLFPRVVLEAKPRDALEVLSSIIELPEHDFWPDSLSYADVDLSQLLGAAQVTDAYLAALARHHGGRVVTFDKGFEQQHADVVTRIRPP